MAAGDTHVANLLDTVHHEMDIAVHSPHVHKSVWSSITAEQLILKKEPTDQSTR